MRPNGIELSWDDLRLMKAVAEAKSVLGGSRLLGVDNSTAFRHIARIESALGTKLFERHRKGYELTQDGANIFALASRIQSDLEQTTLKLASSDQRLAGMIRIATNDSLFFHLLAEVFASFQLKFPNMTLEVVTGNIPLNLSQRDCDVAIRATSNPPENLVGQRLATIAWAPYARRLEANRSIDAEILNGCWVNFGEELAELRPALFIAAHIPESRIVLRVNSTEGALAAVKAGIGAVFLPCYLGDAATGLQRLAPPDPRFEDGLWMLTHPELKKAKRVRHFMDHCAYALSQMKSLISGEGL